MGPAGRIVRLVRRTPWRRTRRALGVAILAWAPLHEAAARPEWASGATRRVPNASVYSCLTCHTSFDPGGCGGECNAFGHAFAANSNTWNATLAGGDADGDLFPNGWELQDANGAWTIGSADPGSAVLVANPGQSPSSPPRISVDPTAIEHTEVAGTNGMESFTVQNSGGDCAGNPNGPCALVFDVTSDAVWVSPDPPGGVGTTLIDLLFSTDALSPGMLDATVSVSAAGVIDSPQEIPVTLVVPEPPQLPLGAAALCSLGLVARRARRREVPGGG